MKQQPQVCLNLCFGCKDMATQPLGRVTELSKLPTFRASIEQGLGTWNLTTWVFFLVRPFHSFLGQGSLTSAI